MIIYRPHKGSLQEALKYKKEFQTEDEMKKYIFEEWKAYGNEIGASDPPFSIDDIVILEEKTDDCRCGWHDTRRVCINRFGSENYIEKYGSPQCIGMCATVYER